MKLVQCHIENFGKLQNQDISFSDGWNICCKENGWGKTTLAVFLKVMFYGFEHERSRDSYSSERRRYRPWQGGVYGGSLTFEAKGKRYIVTRTFGLKEKEDTYELREKETNFKSNDYSEKLGEELFGIDGTSFGKTIFLGQNDAEILLTDRIHAKLGDLSGSIDDMSNYEQADARLNDRINAISPNRKTGSLYRLRERIGQMEAETGRRRSMETELHKLVRTREQLRQEYIRRQEELSMRTALGRSRTEEEEAKLWKEHYDWLMRERDLKYEQAERARILWKEEGDQNPAVYALLSLVAGIICCLLGFLALYRAFHPGMICFLPGILLTVIGAIRMQHQKMTKEYNALLLQSYENAVREAREAEKRKEAFFNTEEAQKFRQILKTKSSHEDRRRRDDGRKIQEQLEQCQRSLMETERRIQEYGQWLDEIGEQEEELRLLREQYQEGVVQYERLKKTRSYLARAKAAYTEKYRNPLLEAFSSYYELLSGDMADGYRMDGDLFLTREELGGQREVRFLSQGWQNLIGICMRMALLDTMYRREKPFLIFDDPFVHLDQNKTAQGKELLRQVSERYQIIYFTCHESRR